MSFDFSALTSSKGVEGCRAERPEEVETAAAAAVADGRPELVEVPIWVTTRATPLASAER